MDIGCLRANLMGKLLELLFALVGQPLTLVGFLFALVGFLFVLVGPPVSPRGIALAPVRNGAACLR